MNFIKTSRRSESIEIMDDFEMEGELLRSSLDQIVWINHWLGGNKVTLEGVKILLKDIPIDQELRIVDLGCGNGDLLRAAAKLAKQQGRKITFIGIDANSYTVNYATQLSADYPEISYQKMMIPSAAFDELEYDIALCTLFLHHFKDNDLLNLLERLKQKAKVGIVINDLHRHWLAYVLFTFISRIFLNPMAREDGLTSILRGFKKKELMKYASILKLKGECIRWRWAFRYQWIITKQHYGKN